MKKLSEIFKSDGFKATMEFLKTVAIIVKTLIE